MQSDDRLWKQAKIACLCIMSASAMGMLLVSNTPFPGMASSEPAQAVLNCPPMPEPPQPATTPPIVPPPSEDSTVTPPPVQLDFTLIDQLPRASIFIERPSFALSQHTQPVNHISITVPDFNVIDQWDNPLTIRWLNPENSLIMDRLEDPMNIQWQNLEYVPFPQLPFTLDFGPQIVIRHLDLIPPCDTDSTATDTQQPTDNSTDSNPTQPSSSDDSTSASNQVTTFQHLNAMLQIDKATGATSISEAVNLRGMGVKPN